MFIGDLANDSGERCGPWPLVPVFSNHFYEYQAFYPKIRKRPHVGMSNNLIYKQDTMYFQKILVCKSPSRGPLLPLLAHGLSKQLTEFKDLLWYVYIIITRTLKIDSLVLCTKCTETSIWRIIRDSMEKPSSDTFQGIGVLNSFFPSFGNFIRNIWNFPKYHHITKC
jgi:hypothetical protein